MDKEILWTNLVGELQVGTKGLYWDWRTPTWDIGHSKYIAKNRDPPLKLKFSYRVDKSWIPNPRNPITLVAIGDQDQLNVSFLEKLEERFCPSITWDIDFMWSCSQNQSRHFFQRKKNKNDGFWSIEEDYNCHTRETRRYQCKKFNRKWGFKETKEKNR